MWKNVYLLFIFVSIWLCLCMCVCLSLFFSLSFLSSSVRMPRLQAPDNVDTNTCILQGALGSTEALQLSAHSVHIFQRMGWTTILKEDLTGNTYVESLSETHYDHIFHLWFWKAVPGFAHGFLALALLPCCIRLRHVNSIGKSLGCPVAHGVAVRSSSQLGPWLKRGTLKLCLRPFGMNTKVDSEQFNFEHFGANQWFNQFDNV